MRKEDVLERARKNKRIGEEYDNKQLINSTIIGVTAAFIISVIMILIKYFVEKTINIELIAVISIGYGVQSLHEGIKLKKVSMSIIGVLSILMSLAFILLFIKGIMSI